jgi:hypothetical protein
MSSIHDRSFAHLRHTLRAPAAFHMLTAAATVLAVSAGMAQTSPPVTQDTQRSGNGSIAVRQEPAKPSGRYVMKQTQNGFLRLDSQTGAVSLCTVKDNKLTCQSSADERAALEAEIARLARKNAELEKKLADASKSTAQRLREVLPSDKEMDKALSFAEKFMRRMMRIMREEDKKEPQDRI